MEFRTGVAEACREISEEHLKELLNIASHVEGSRLKLTDLTFRFAPSIVIRSEAELMGISHPRFALRAYLPRGGFINVRRTSNLQWATPKWSCRQNAHPQWQRMDIQHITPDPDGVSPAEVLSKGSCVADSLLRASPKLRGRFHILETDLGWCYGESAPMRGTPFMKHVLLSGLCSQAVCFMASSLLHDNLLSAGTGVHPPIHGVAEVCAVMAREEDNEVQLDGLTSDEIVYYLQKVGHAAWLEEPQSSRVGLRPGDFFQACLDSYLRSGVPVIVLVNYEKLRQVVEAFETGATVTDEIRNKPASHDHAVLVVGVSNETQPQEVLLHDPADRPFISLSLELLRTASRLAASESDACVAISGCLIPVLPRHVRLGLEVTDRTRCGLFDIAEKIQAGRPHWFSRRWPGQFRLVRSDGDLSFLPPAMREQVRQVFKQVGGASHWCWVQTLTQSGSPEAWVWDAQEAPENRYDLRLLKPEGIESRFLMGRVYPLSDGGYGKDRLGRKRPDESNQEELDHAVEVQEFRAPAQSVTFKPALLSSATLEGLPRAVEWWPRGIGCELYAFCDRDELLPHPKTSGKDKRMGAVARMARFAREKTAARDVARAALDLLARRSAPIVGLASFIPEIVAVPVQEHQYDTMVKTLAGTHDAGLSNGQMAVVFLIQLARELCALQPQLQVLPIELVGGSRVAGLWSAKVRKDPMRPDEKTYFVNRFTSGQSIALLARSIRKILEFAKPQPGDRFVLSFELEPGGNYVLSQLEHLEELFHYFPAGDPLCRYVGINLDISHWLLSGIAPSPEVLNRIKPFAAHICHVHISDVGHAHFGDAPLGDVEVPQRSTALPKWESFARCCERYDPWLNLLAHACEQKRKAAGAPPFSGHVSLELEACRSHDQVNLSLGLLQALLWSWEARCREA